jgi:hypothetical protein
MSYFKKITIKEILDVMHCSVKYFEVMENFKHIFLALTTITVHS